MIASIAGFATTGYLRQRDCADDGGRWHPESRLCELPNGDMLGTVSVSSVVAGIAVALLLGFMLFRASLFISGRRDR
jgi:hypothetical protein